MNDRSLTILHTVNRRTFKKSRTLRTPIIKWDALAAYSFQGIIQWENERLKTNLVLKSIQNPEQTLSPDEFTWALYIVKGKKSRLKGYRNVTKDNVLRNGDKASVDCDDMDSINITHNSIKRDKMVYADGSIKLKWFVDLSPHQARTIDTTEKEKMKCPPRVKKSPIRSRGRTDRPSQKTRRVDHNTRSKTRKRLIRENEDGSDSSGNECRGLEHTIETVQMPAEASQPLSSLVDPYLWQVASLLQSYWNAVYEITKQKLVVQQKAHPQPEPGVDQLLQIIINISVPVEFPKVVESHGSGSAQAYRHSDNESQQVQSNEEVLYLIELLKLYNYKLQDVVKLELMTVQGEVAQKLTESMTCLDDFTNFLDKIAACYAMKYMTCCDDSLPSLEVLKENKDKVCGMKNDLKQDELSHLFAKYSDKFTTSYENIWCSILGLRDEFGTCYLQLDDEMKMHQTWYYYIVNYIESEETNLLKKDGYLEESGRDGLIKKLQKIGFTEKRAEVIADSIPDDLIDTQLPSYWAIKHLDFEVLYHPLLTNLPRYPFIDSGYDVWFRKDVAIDKRSEPAESGALRSSQWQVNMINVTAEKGETKVMEFLRELNDQRDYVLLYHGTSHDSALSILQSGIKLGEGRRFQDFSHGYGFYLGENLEKAKRWTRDSSAHNAVVVFKVKQDLVDPRKENGLDVTRNARKWDQIVRLYRNGCEDTRLEEELLEGITFIRGPVCANPAKASTEECLLFMRFNRRWVVQFCIRDIKYARKFGSIENIACVVFY